MSAYIVEDKTINRILSFLFWNDSIEKEHLKKLVNDCGYFVDDDKACKKFGQALLNMNIKAVSYRYDEKSPAQEFEYKDLHNVSIFQALKSLHCLIYQCDEGDIPEMELFKLLKKIKAIISSDIIDSLPSYTKAEWG